MKTEKILIYRMMTNGDRNFHNENPDRTEQVKITLKKMKNSEPAFPALHLLSRLKYIHS